MSSSRRGRGGGSTARGARRGLSQRVHTARQRSLGSTIWLQRQLNDPYVAEAKLRGYRSRAAFKLAQLDDRFELIKPASRIIDLGCAPGGWLQVALERLGPKGKLVGIDLLPVDSLDGAIILEGDFLDETAPAQLREALGGAADLVLSDMAANAMGHRKTDHLRTMALAETAAYFALENLAPGGSFVSKVLQGGTEATLLTLLKKSFENVRHAKPAASRKGSSEVYLVARGFRGLPAAPDDGAEG
ncbi:MAG: RlmE family RNA methyltransferase [Rhodospirillales bacterium]